MKINLCLLHLRLTSARKSVFGLVALALLVLTTISAQRANANTITTFSVAGTAQNGSILSGTITIDTTVGVATSAAITSSGPFSFTVSGLIQGRTDVTTFNLDITDGVSDASLYLPVASLVGYGGGRLCSQSNGAGCADVSVLVNAPHSFSTLLNGSLTAVPEPGTPALLTVAFLTFVLPAALSRRIACSPCSLADDQERLA